MNMGAQERRRINSMKESGISIRTGALFVIFFFMVTSCATTATTELKKVWRDSDYGGKIKKVLVIGVIKRPAIKRFFELEMAKQLEDRGIDAIAGNLVLPHDKEADKDLIVSTLKELDADGVLIATLINRKTVEQYIPGDVYYGRGYYAPPAHYRRMHSYYSRSYGTVYSPGYTTKNEIVVVDTNLFEAGSEQLVWSALSETFVEGDSEKLISTFVEVMINDLFKQNLFE
jgi:hypothetical protein